MTTFNLPQKYHGMFTFINEYKTRTIYKSNISFGINSTVVPDPWQSLNHTSCRWAVKTSFILSEMTSYLWIYCNYRYIATWPTISYKPHECCGSSDLSETSGKPLGTSYLYLWSMIDSKRKEMVCKPIPIYPSPDTEGGQMLRAE